jgi:predicted RNA-binding Zn-ribbon protein involved in translation (DUF1610 family)
LKVVFAMKDTGLEEANRLHAGRFASQRVPPALALEVAERYWTARARAAPESDYIAPEMEGAEHSSREVTVSVKVPCPECGGLGYIQRVKAGHVVGDKTKKCPTCRGRGLIPDDMPISQLRELLK